MQGIVSQHGAGLQKNRCRAFTLIELLVVIIALLVGLLLSGLTLWAQHRP